MMMIDWKKLPGLHAPKLPLPVPPGPVGGKLGQDVAVFSGAVTPERVEAAFQRRDKAQALILGRQAQANIGWDPQRDVAYQQALKDLESAKAEIERCRAVEPELVAAAEARHSAGGQLKGFFERLSGWLFGKS